MDERAGKLLAFDVRREFNEAADTLGRGDVEAIGITRLLGLSEIVALALTGKPYPLAGRDRAIENASNVAIGAVNG